MQIEERYPSKNPEVINFKTIQDYKTYWKYPILVAGSQTNLPKDSIRPGRRVGNTTRIIDNAIQLLFAGHIVEASDHHHSDDARSYVFRKILDRLSMQFRFQLERDYLIDTKKFAIMLKPELWSK